MTNEPKDPLLMDHEADGIKELDNLMPRWWVWLFILSIVWSLVYVIYYHVARVGPSSAAEYQREVARSPKAAAAAPAPGAPPAAGAVAAAPTVSPVADAARLDNGKKVYTQFCLSCHNAQGQGLVGPNLIDDYTIHGATFADFKRIVEEGVVAKGMLPWKAMLKPDDLLDVCSFVWSLRGTAAPNPKAPEGEKAGAPGAGPGAAPAAAAPAAAPDTDTAHLDNGKKVYTQFCLSCHNAQGQGLVGPNLIDDYTIHGATFADFKRIVEEGVVAKGMLAWKAMLKPGDLQDVCSYVWSLRGTAAPNPKAPEGEKAPKA